MKTLTTINNLKKLGTAIIASLIISTSAVHAGKGEANAAMVRLENFVEMSEAGLKYVAPTPEMEWLNNFTDTAEASLKYEAPAEDENVEIVPALERLEMLAETTEASLKYEAPAIDEVVFELHSENTNSLMAETK